MDYEVVTLPKKKVVCLGTRTANNAPDCKEKIGGLWKRFMCDNALPRAEGVPCYALYTHYNWDDQSYDALVGCESAVCPEGFEEVVIPAGSYAKFTLCGDVREATAKAWGEIWSMRLPRAYTVDFEEYIGCDDDMQGGINIYIALANICQSCSMPMLKPEDYGTERNGSRNRAYCKYCYQNGSFTSDCTMEDMIELNIKYAPEVYKDPEASREHMRSFFPTLERWKAR